MAALSATSLIARPRGRRADISNATRWILAATSSSAEERLSTSQTSLPITGGTGAERQLSRATNTDWLGIKGCLLEKGDQPGVPVLNKPALIVGAGGASRAVVYALSSDFKSGVIYGLNRDKQEVADLVRDSQRLSPVPKVIHVKAGEAKNLETPYYVVGTVPDLEPKTPEELSVKENLEDFLSRPETGVLLDMCFKPRRTRMIKLAEKLGWPAVEGTHVIGYQIEEQWGLWAGPEKVEKLDKAGAWKTLLEAAELSPGINF